jgi:hypothetical protein
VISNSEISSLFSAVGIPVEFADNAASLSYPSISIRKLMDEFSFHPEQVLPLMQKIISKQIKL